MYYQYPLEVVARRRGAGSQLDFARAARLALAGSDEVMPEAMARGLVLFAAHEDALDGPVRALEEIYGSELEIRGPRVRMIPGKPPQEPIMHVRIATRRATAWQVLQELRARQARVLEECVRGRLVVIRAEAPLSLLVGLPAILAILTDGEARCAMRLLRYAPLRDATEDLAASELPMTGG